MLRKNKIILVLLLTIFCLSIGSVCATDVDNTVNSIDITNVDTNANSNDQIIVDDTKIIDEQSISEDTDISKVEAIDKTVKENNIYKGADESSSIKIVSKSYSYYETFDDIVDAARRYKDYVEKNKKLPKTVKVGQHTYSHEDFTYLMAKAIKNSNNGDFSAIQVKSLKSYNPLNYKVNVTLSKNRYVFLASFDLDWIAKYKKHPNYVNLSEASYIRYDTYSYGFAKILVEAEDNGYKLPDSCLFDSSVFNSTTPPGPSPTPTGDTVTIAQILKAAQNYNTHIKKTGELPDYITIGDKLYSKQQFTYAMAQAIYQINSRNKQPITIPSVKMCTLKDYKCNRYYQKYNYVDFAKIVADYVKGNSAVPSYIKYGGTYVPHIAYSAAFAKILTYYNNTGVLPAKALFTTNGLGTPGAGPADDSGLNDEGVDADVLNAQNADNVNTNNANTNNANTNNVNTNSNTLPNTGNPLLVLLFALAVLPILRIKK